MRVCILHICAQWMCYFCFCLLRFGSLRFASNVSMFTNSNALAFVIPAIQFYSRTSQEMQNKTTATVASVAAATRRRRMKKNLAEDFLIRWQIHSACFRLVKCLCVSERINAAFIHIRTQLKCPPQYTMNW